MYACSILLLPKTGRSTYVDYFKYNNTSSHNSIPGKYNIEHEYKYGYLVVLNGIELSGTSKCLLVAKDKA